RFPRRYSNLMVIIFRCETPSGRSHPWPAARLDGARRPAEVLARSRFVVHDAGFLFWRTRLHAPRPRDDMRQPATTKATGALSQIAETLDRAGLVLLRRLASFPRPLCP